MKWEAILPAALAMLGAAQFSRLAVPGRFRALYEEMGARHGVDPNMLHAIALQESREDPAAVSPANTNGTRDYGLMQLNSSNLERFGLTTDTALDATRSVDAAARLLAANRRAAPGLTFLDELSVYNAGWRRDAAGKLGPRLASSGAYVNQTYVMQAGSWYALVTLASFAPITTLGWAARRG